MVGTFYLSPLLIPRLMFHRSEVQEDTVVCIIGAMKVMKRN